MARRRSRWPRAAQTTIEKVMVFAAPVLAERAHVAERARASSLRRKAGDTGARTLGEAVSAHLHGFNIDPGTVEWDARRREDGRWTPDGPVPHPQRKGRATFAFDMRGNFVTSEDEDARWLVGEAVRPAPAASTQASRDDLQQARARRLNAVPADELPLGEDAIELVADEADPAETTMEISDQPVEAFLDNDQPADASEGDRAATSEVEEVAQRPSRSLEDQPTDPAADEPPSRRPARKGRGRASVPSWDEIMFGGPGEK
ncbi:septation protein SepH [Nocardioides sp. B-3]|uniref:septation protein SepH n=1 Tax=Nocardioides sp. B-3 TaxID=2895565 RepID=UPI003FA549CB